MGMPSLVASCFFGRIVFLDAANPQSPLCKARSTALKGGRTQTLQSKPAAAPKLISSQSLEVVHSTRTNYVNGTRTAFALAVDQFPLSIDHTDFSLSVYTSSYTSAPSKGASRLRSISSSQFSLSLRTIVIPN